MKISFFVFGFLLNSFLFSSCGNSSNSAKPNDYLNDFIELEASSLDEMEYGISKKIQVNDAFEDRTFNPKWKDELAFLNGYINDFRKNGKLENPQIEVTGDTTRNLYAKSANKSLEVLSVNNQVIEFTILENQNTFFSTRSFVLNYKSKQSYELSDHSKSLWIMKNDVDIKSSILAR